MKFCYLNDYVLSVILLAWAINGRLTDAMSLLPVCVTKELALVAMAQRTTTCYALVGTGTRGKCGHQRETSSCRYADNGLWHCLLSFLLFSKHLSKLPRDFAKRAIGFEHFFIDLDPNY